MSESLSIEVEFIGGLEMFFSNQKKHKLQLPSKDENGQAANMRFLIQYLAKYHMKNPKKEMFLLNGGIRPGILVLINDADWELEGEDDYELQDGDNVLFVSTLHGG
ncbi:Ubiquitin- modifier 1 [Agyrium rufum]|nr:Ubiquitin- modifier 1 [Agyrium rufum]